MTTPTDMELVIFATSPPEFQEKLKALMEDYDDPMYIGDACGRCGSTVWPADQTNHNHFHRQLTFVMKLQGLSMDTLMERINALEDALVVEVGDGR